MTSALDTILASGGDAIEQLLRDAYQAGVDVGRREGLSMIQEAATTFLRSGALPEMLQASAAEVAQKLPQVVVRTRPISTDASLVRRPRGSVRPAIIAFLRSGQQGRPADVAQATDQNENSVRGMLNMLAQDGLAEKQGDIWGASAKLMESELFGGAPSETEDAPT